MATMKQTVEKRLDRIERKQDRLKAARYGFLIGPATLVLGWVILIVGIIAIPFPGPGWLAVFIGVGILSLELRWARRVLVRGVGLYDAYDNWIDQQSKPVHWAVNIALVLVILATFAAIAWVGWKTGNLPVLDPVFS